MIHAMNNSSSLDAPKNSNTTPLSKAPQSSYSPDKTPQIPNESKENKNNNKNKFHEVKGLENINSNTTADQVVLFLEKNGVEKPQQYQSLIQQMVQFHNKKKEEKKEKIADTFLTLLAFIQDGKWDQKTRNTVQYNINNVVTNTDNNQGKVKDSKEKDGKEKEVQDNQAWKNENIKEKNVFLRQKEIRDFFKDKPNESVEVVIKWVKRTISYKQAEAALSDNKGGLITDAFEKKMNEMKAKLKAQPEPKPEPNKPEPKPEPNKPEPKPEPNKANESEPLIEIVEENEHY